MQALQSYLIDIIIDDSKLPKLLHLPRYIIKLVQVDGQRRLVDHSLHAGHSEAVVVRVVEASVHHAVLAEAEDLPVDQRADLPVPDGADEAFALQVDGLKNTSCLVIRETDPSGVIEDLCQLVLRTQETQQDVFTIMDIGGYLLHSQFTSMSAINFNLSGGLKLCSCSGPVPQHHPPPATTFTRNTVMMQK